AARPPDKAWRTSALIVANSGAPVHSFYLANATGGAPVNLVVSLEFCRHGPNGARETVGHYGQALECGSSPIARDARSRSRWCNGKRLRGLFAAPRNGVGAR